MRTNMQRIGMVVASGLAALTLWACQADRNSDGTATICFAPDMCIVTSGLEDALGKLFRLLTACLEGTFHRPCTDDEIDDIHDAIEKVLRRKERVRRPGSLPQPA